MKGSLAKLYETKILTGLNYLNDRLVVHSRDIRCANILVDVSGSVKLADFGLAKECLSISFSTRVRKLSSIYYTAFTLALLVSTNVSKEFCRWHNNFSISSSGNLIYIQVIH
ncbi:Protein kinase, catalytic domain-containing protein [Cynara cardunculus var. scolymus]|uniref:Protein kinase, catalytic domain-containing protein n=1 Tax=Cynara cardunculus var. scolymus TaxID=59895 RepID=A0A103WV88_CYNCS|nr:Protein kinase, catalytic domain-containing protein [Cynara cardunculus var. scolymus]